MSSVYAARFEATHNAARVVSCQGCARTLAWIDMLTLVSAGWTWRLSDDPNRLEWRCPECREPLIAVRDELRAKSLERAPSTLVQYARRLSRPHGAFGVVHDVELGNDKGDDPHALCGLGTDGAQQVMLAALVNCKRCKRCARVRLERGKDPGKNPETSAKRPKKGGRHLRIDLPRKLCREKRGP